MAKRYDIKGKTYFKYPNKYYYTDIGLRNARLNYRQYDPGHIMENIIYNELLRRGYSVDVGVVTDRTGGANVQKEIDFVVNDADKKIYIQSAFQMDTDRIILTYKPSLIPFRSGPSGLLLFSTVYYILASYASQLSRGMVLFYAIKGGGCFGISV